MISSVCMRPSRRKRSATRVRNQARGSHGCGLRSAAHGVAQRRAGVAAARAPRPAPRRCQSAVRTRRRLRRLNAPSSTTSPGGQALSTSTASSVRRPSAPARLHPAGSRTSQTVARRRPRPGRCAAPPAAAPARARGARFPPRPTASCPRAGRAAAAQRELHLDRTALRVHQRARCSTRAAKRWPGKASATTLAAWPGCNCSR
jgi:hypothetical protein